MAAFTALALGLAGLIAGKAMAPKPTDGGGGREAIGRRDPAVPVSPITPPAPPVSGAPAAKVARGQAAGAATVQRRKAAAGNLPAVVGGAGMTAGTPVAALLQPKTLLGS